MRPLYLLYLAVVAAPIFLAATLLTALLTTIGCALGARRIFAYYPGMLWSRLTCCLAGCPVKVIGAENLPTSKPAIYIANHQGAFDIFLIYGHLGCPVRWVMKAGLQRIPFVGQACRAAGFIFVDNSSRKNAIRSIAQSEQCISEGDSIMIFPEASRTYDGKMIRFKKGAFQMALDQNTPIVPITINGSYEVLPINSRTIHSHPMELIIHSPIEVNHTSDIKSLIDQTHTTISSALWHQYR